MTNEQRKQRDRLRKATKEELYSLRLGDPVWFSRSGPYTNWEYRVVGPPGFTRPTEGDHAALSPIELRVGSTFAIPCTPIGKAAVSSHGGRAPFTMWWSNCMVDPDTLDYGSLEIGPDHDDLPSDATAE